jgi:CBS domain-containing protein
MLVKEIMTRNVVTIDANASVVDACMKYRDEKIGCIVVLKNKECLGIVTERDIIERTICMKRDPANTPVADIMSPHLITINVLDSVDKAIDLMKNYKIKKLPVIQHDSIVGILTVTDISRSRPTFSQRFIETWVKPQWRD